MLFGEYYVAIHSVRAGMIPYLKEERMLLTMQGGILFPFSWLFGKLMELIYNILAVDGVANVGICIIIFTVIVKIILLPLNFKMQLTTKINQIIQPELKKIQNKYKNKTDNESMRKQQAEMNDLYAKYGTSMSAGCGPSLIQFPIVLGFYDVVRNIAAYVNPVKSLYQPIAEKIVGMRNYQELFTKFIEANSGINSNAKYAVNALEKAKDQTNGIIDIIDKFSATDWNSFMGMDTIKGNSEIISAITANIDKINSINDFAFGINISEPVGWKLTPLLVIPIASTLFQWLSMKVSMAQTKKNQGTENDMANSMMKTMMFMPIMSFFMCILFPIGIGIYWALNSFISFLIQLGLIYYYDHIVDMDKVIEKRVEKAKKKNGGQRKKSFMEKMLEAQGGAEEAQAQMSQKVSGKNLKSYDASKAKSVDSSGKKYKSGSMASKANIMLNYDDKK